MLSVNQSLKNVILVLSLTVAAVAVTVASFVTFAPILAVFGALLLFAARRTSGPVRSLLAAVATIWLVVGIITPTVFYTTHTDSSPSGPSRAKPVGNS